MCYIYNYKKNYEIYIDHMNFILCYILNKEYVFYLSFLNIKNNMKLYPNIIYIPLPMQGELSIK